MPFYIFRANSVSVRAPFSLSSSDEEREGERGKNTPTSVRVPLPPRKKRTHVLDDPRRDAGRKHDAAQWSLAPREAKRAPLGAPRGVHDEAALLPAQRRIARLRQKRREQRAVARQRRQRDGLPRRAGRHLHRARLALALHLHDTTRSNSNDNEEQ
jgi:hypothetical protein